MVRRSYKLEHIINKLREAEVLLSQVSKAGEAARKIGVTEQTYYRLAKENTVGSGLNKSKGSEDLREGEFST